MINNLIPLICKSSHQDMRGYILHTYNIFSSRVFREYEEYGEYGECDKVERIKMSV